MTIEHDQVERARRARELLDNSLLAEALEAIEREVFDMWADAPALSMPEKEALWQHVRACRNFKAMLNGYINTGTLAADKLRRLEDKPTLMQRLKRA